jgi:hypothetical protein
MSPLIHTFRDLPLRFRRPDSSRKLIWEKREKNKKREIERCSTNALITLTLRFGKKRTIQKKYREMQYRRVGHADSPRKPLWEKRAIQKKNREMQYKRVDHGRGYTLTVVR